MSKEKTKIGVLFLEDIQNPKSPAWAGLPDEKVEYLNAIGEANTGVVWVTNLDYNTMMMYGYERHARFRNMDFLGMAIERRIMPEVVACEFDEEMTRFQPVHYGLSEIVERLANLAERQVRLVQKFVMSDTRKNWKPHPFSLIKQMREEMLPPDPDMRDQRELARALFEARQEWTRCSIMMGENDMQIALALPRYRHMLEVLSAPVPITPDVKKVPKPYPTTSEDIILWAGPASKGPMLVRADISDFDREIETMFNYGGMVRAVNFRGRSRKKKMQAQRLWLTNEDIIMLADHAKIEIKDALYFVKFESALRHRRIMDFVEAVEKGPPAFKASWSVNFFALNLWKALSSSNPPMFSRGIDNIVSENIVSAFIRARDRYHCFQAANTLRRRGYSVLGYGSGSVHVLVDKRDRPLNNAMNAALEVGLIPPMQRRNDAIAMSQADELNGVENIDPVYKSMMKAIGYGLDDQIDMLDQRVIDSICGE